MNYQTYHLKKTEIIKYGACYLSVCFLFGKLFYDSFAAGLLGFLAIPYLWKVLCADLADRRRERLALSFQDLILSFGSALRSGYSMENAFREADRDIRLLHKEEEDICKESRMIICQIENNHPLEELLMDFGKRSMQPDIRDFASVFLVARKSGGDMGKIIQNTAKHISEKMELKREIKLLFAAKKMEQRVMSIVPSAIILYIRVTSPGYFAPLYGNPAGIVIMTVCLIVYILSILLSHKIMHIEV